MTPFGSYLTEVAINGIRANIISIEHRSTSVNRVSAVSDREKRKIVATMRMVQGMYGLIEIFESAFIMEAHLLEAMKTDNDFTAQSSLLGNALKFADAALPKDERTSQIEDVLEMGKISLNVFSTSQKFVNDASPVFMNRVHEVMGHLQFQMEFLSFLTDAYVRVLDDDVVNLHEQLITIVQSSNIWQWRR